MAEKCRAERWGLQTDASCNSVTYLPSPSVEKDFDLLLRGPGRILNKQLHFALGW